MLVQTMTRQYDAAFADVASDGTLYMEILDERPLSKLAKELETAGAFERLDEMQGDRMFEGYTELTSMARVAPGRVLAAIRKGATV